MRKQLLYKGHLIYYEVRGKGMPVMLVHGFTEDRQIWDGLLQGMEEKYQWLLPDLPGSGDSPFNENLSSITDYATALQAITQTENLTPLAVIGHSMGGYIALAFAEKYPEETRGLGLFHSTAYADSPQKKESREKNIRFIKKNSPAVFVEQAIPGLFSEAFKSSNAAVVRQIVERYANFIRTSRR